MVKFSRMFSVFLAFVAATTSAFGQNVNASLAAALIHRVQSFLGRLLLRRIRTPG